MRLSSHNLRGGPSLRLRIYEAIWSNLTDGGRASNYARGGYTDAKIWATACALERWLKAAHRLEEQISADTVLELLADREAEFGVIVPAGATLAQRRTALRLAMRAPAGGTYGAIRQALVDLLGSQFVQLRKLPANSLVSRPTVPFNGPGLFTNPTARRLTFKLAVSVSSPAQMGAQVGIPYVHLDGSPVALEDGFQTTEKIVVEPGHNVLLDRATCGALALVSVPGVGPTASVRLALAHPHHQGALLTNQPYPYLYSNRRHWVVQLAPAAALDPRVRGQVHWLMRRLVRGVSTWDVVSSAAGFTLGTSPLSVTPLG